MSHKYEAVCLNLFFRKKTATKAGMIPQLPLFDSPPWKRPEERKQAAMKELNEKKAILEQKRKWADFGLENKSCFGFFVSDLLQSVLLSDSPVEAKCLFRSAAHKPESHKTRKCLSTKRRSMKDKKGVRFVCAWVFSCHPAHHQRALEHHLWHTG